MDPFNSLVFDRSPTPMWLKDYSAVKQQLDLWRKQGVFNLREFLEEDSSRVDICVSLVKVIKVNQKTLDLFGSLNFADFAEYSKTLIVADFYDINIELIVQMWEKREFSILSSLYHSCSEKSFHLRVSGYVLPNPTDNWSQVLISTEDLTSYQHALDREEFSRKLAESFFNHSPAALLMENFNPIKSMLDKLRQKGIENLENYLESHPNFTLHCLESLQIIDANQSALDLLHAPDKDYLIKHYQRVLVHKCMPNVMRHNLLQMWQGVLSTQQESCFIDFDGNAHYVLLQLTVLPNHEHDWGRVQVALTDITAMKQAEQRLKFASERDSLTNVYNRTYYAQVLQHLEIESQNDDLSCIFIDINGLKKINDENGHEAGDRLIIQTAKVLQELVENTDFTLSRIGGDEFVILMPSTDANELRQYVKQLNTLIEKENHEHTHTLSFSMGFSTRQPHETIKEMLHRVDQLMYKDKQAYYQIHDRRIATIS